MFWLLLAQAFCFIATVSGVSRRGSFCAPLTVSLSQLAIFCIMFSHVVIHRTEGGICWRGRNGRCSSWPMGYLVERGVTEEECCSRPQAGLAWSSEDLTDRQISSHVMRDGGIPKCTSCKSLCETVQCSDGYKCKLRRGTARCVCSPNCSKLSRPLRRNAVCGIDLRTYRNYCSMLKYNCRHTQSIVMDYMGPCRGMCSQVKCEPGKSCLTDQNGLPHCIPCSPRTCHADPDSRRHVCGTDQVTYRSDCHFTQAKCLLSMVYSLNVSHGGPCQGRNMCNNSTCAANQKCLTDHLSGRRVCVDCGSPCVNPLEGQVCGSNEQKYLNWCQMRQFSCSSGILIHSMHHRFCISPYTDKEASQEDDEDEDDISSGSSVSNTTS